MLILITPLLYTGCSCSEPNKSSAIRAVWWWDDSLDSKTSKQYLDFAETNGINQIYYSSSEFGDITANFISQAKDRDISVFWLDGNYQWLTDENKKSVLLQKLANYKEYNQSHPSQQFSGVHFDIEPHQADDFDSNRESLILSLITLAHELKTNNPNIHFTYDIPFWLHDEITFNNSTKPAYAHMIDIADNIVVMSYRDSAEKIISVAEEELEYASSINKTITVSVECGDHGDNISFYEEGRTILNNELQNVYNMTPQNTGMCIHHIKSWYNLKD